MLSVEASLAFDLERWRSLQTQGLTTQPVRKTGAMEGSGCGTRQRRGSVAVALLCSVCSCFPTSGCLSDLRRQAAQPLSAAAMAPSQVVPGRLARLRTATLVQVTRHQTADVRVVRTSLCFWYPWPQPKKQRAIDATVDWGTWNFNPFVGLCHSRAA